MAATGDVMLYRYNQNDAVTTFPRILQAYLPQSNPLFNRVQSPQNLPEKHCLFAATFPLTMSLSPTPEVWTIIFADRSRHKESQIWIHNPLINASQPLTSQQNRILKRHLMVSVEYLRDVQIPEAPGWPFGKELKFACLHEVITKTLFEIYPDGIPYVTRWNQWDVSLLSSETSAQGQINVTTRARRELPEGHTISRVPESQLDLVVSTSLIPRQFSTLKLQANVGVLDPDGTLVAWGYLGIDGSIATLYVTPEKRGKGLATIVAQELLAQLGNGDFEDLGVNGGSGWVHADVKVGNEGSEGVMRSLGGSVGWTSAYLWIDGEKT